MIDAGKTRYGPKSYHISSQQPLDTKRSLSFPLETPAQWKTCIFFHGETQACFLVGINYRGWFIIQYSVGEFMIVIFWEITGFQCVHVLVIYFGVFQSPPTNWSFNPKSSGGLQSQMVIFRNFSLPPNWAVTETLAIGCIKGIILPSYMGIT